MTAKLVFKSVCGIIAAVAFTACCGNGIEGRWVEPVPGMENQVQGMNLERGGKASSINMATLQYDRWEKCGDRLLLSGRSIGNGTTIDFTDTLTIVKLTPTDLTLQRGDLTLNFQRQ